MSLKADDPAAPYRQIAANLRKEILSEALKPGERLPSARELMERYGVATQTVQNAFRLLRAEELIYSVQGRGTFVRDDLNISDLPNDEAQSPAYLDILEHLEVIGDEMSKLDERLSQLEEERSKREH